MINIYKRWVMRRTPPSDVNLSIQDINPVLLSSVDVTKVELVNITNLNVLKHYLYKLGTTRFDYLLEDIGEKINSSKKSVNSVTVNHYWWLYEVMLKIKERRVNE